MRLRGLSASGLYIALFMIACAREPSSTVEQTFEIDNGQEAFTGHGNSKLLTSQELVTYHADRKYVRSLMKRGIAMQINHADPRQHRFAVARMKLAGKTAANSPELFDQMERLQVSHAARGLTPGQMLPMTVDDGSLQSQHQMLSTGRAPTPGVVGSAAMASRRDSLSYGYVDCNVYDGDGNALGDTSYNEVFGNLGYFEPKCTGDSSFASAAGLEGDSFLTETVLSTNVTNQSYILGQVVASDDMGPTLTTPTVYHPADLNHDGMIQVCLSRGDSTCEYPGVGASTLRMPLMGSVSITNGTFDLTELGQYQRGVDSGSRIWVTLRTNYGGCVLPAGGAFFNMKTFWSFMTYDSTHVNWDLYTTTADWAEFSSSCHLVQDRVDLTMILHLPVIAGGFTEYLDVEISSANPETAPNYHMPLPVTVINSCLAAGTQISTGHGAAQSIESIHIGDQIANPFASQLTVDDMTIGIEREPMVHVVDSLGHELMMTEKHPLYVADRGMVAAVQLKVGDEIKTLDGPAKLVKITREAYTGKVYNLKLGNEREAAALATDQTVMYANGILVGDSQIQTKHEFMDLRAQIHRNPLPSRWRKDYLSSLERNHAGQ